MTIELSKEKRDEVQAAIKTFVADELDHDIGDLKASLILDFFLRELGPTVYNQAVADAQRYLQVRLDDMSGVVYAPAPPRRAR